MIKKNIFIFEEDWVLLQKKRIDLKARSVAEALQHILRSGKHLKIEDNK